jgi:HEAT repeat protein
LDALRRALRVPDHALRADAAMTADAFQWLRVPDWLADVLAHDPTPAVVLALAVALRSTQPEVAHTTLSKLAVAQHPVVSVEAAALLLDMDDDAGWPVLHAARSHTDVTTRRAAYRALGRHGDVQALAMGLDDSDVSVRLAAAGSILRATH